MKCKKSIEYKKTNKKKVLCTKTMRLKNVYTKIKLTAATYNLQHLSVYYFLYCILSLSIYLSIYSPLKDSLKKLKNVGQCEI